MSAFEKKDYKQSYDYYLSVLKARKNDIAAKFGAGISAVKNQDIENGIKYLQEVSNSEDDILASMANFNLANIYKDKNRLEESLFHYKKSIELNPKDKDAKINYELLKKMLEQSDQESGNNQGDEGEEKQSDQESGNNQGDEGEEKQSDQESGSNQGDEGEEKQSDQESTNNKTSDANTTSDVSRELSDREIQAEAILNALKGQEKINQKQKLLKLKAKTVEKDW